MLFSRVLSENWRKKIHFLIAYVMDIKIAAVWNISQKRKDFVFKMWHWSGCKIELVADLNRAEACLSVLEIAHTYEGIRARKSWKNTVN